MTRRIGPSSLGLATLALIGAAAFAASAATPGALNDGRVHGFSGCLEQESGGVRYFDLKNAKTDDGTKLGTVRLTGSVWGITPKAALDHEVHLNGVYRGHLGDDPDGGHLAVKDSAVVADHCS
jgi:hypothetical protein